MTKGGGFTSSEGPAEGVWAPRTRDGGGGGKRVLRQYKVLSSTREKDAQRGTDPYPEPHSPPVTKPHLALGPWGPPEGRVGGQPYVLLPTVPKCPQMSPETRPLAAAS